jgi:hypothetical protein
MHYPTLLLRIMQGKNLDLNQEYDHKINVQNPDQNQEFYHEISN